MKDSPILTLVKAPAGGQKIQARQLGNVPDAPCVALHPIEPPSGVELVRISNLVVGYKVVNKASFVFEPARLPLMRIRALLLCIEYVDIRSEDEEVLASFQAKWMNGNGGLRVLYTEPMPLKKNGDVFRFVLPIATREQVADVDSGKAPPETIDQLVDPTISLSCGLDITMITEGVGLIARAVWLEVAG